MKFPEIIANLREGKYVVWIDDKQDAPLDPEYLEAHFVAFVDSIDGGYKFCDELHTGERNQYGRAITRYRISGLHEDQICSEDLTVEEITRITENLPMSEADRTHAMEHLKK